MTILSRDPKPDRSVSGSLAPSPRVVHVIDNLRIGGAQRLLLTLAEHLDEPGALQVIDLDGTQSFFADRLSACGVKLSRACVRRVSRPGSWFRALRAIRASGADIVHLHLTNATIFGAPIAKLLGKKVVVTLHNMRTVRTDRRMLSRLKLRIESWCLRHFADFVIFVGLNVQKFNLERLQDVPQAVIANVMAKPAPIAPGTRGRIRASLGRETNDVVLLSTGRLNPQKDHLTMLSAFAGIVERRPDTYLWIAGDGELREKLEEVSHSLGLGEHVRFLGAIPDIGDLLASADIFVMSSAWEGLPLGLIEAMALGLPVVATKVGDVPGVLAEGGGLLVEPQSPRALAEAILSLCDDAKLRAQLSVAARSAAQPYMDVDLWTRNTMKVYGKVFER